MQNEPNTGQAPFQIQVADRVQRLPPYLFGKINDLKYRKRRDGVDIGEEAVFVALAERADGFAGVDVVHDALAVSRVRWERKRAVGAWVSAISASVNSPRASSLIARLIRQRIMY